MVNYIANWALVGFKGKDFAPGEIVIAEPEEVVGLVGGVLTEVTSEPPQNLDDLDIDQLKVLAKELEASFHPNTGRAKLVEIIKAKQDELLAKQDNDIERAKRDTRIAELDAKGEDLSEEEKAELDSLLKA